MILKLNKKMDDIIKIIEKKNGSKSYYILYLLDETPKFIKIKKPSIHTNTTYISSSDFSKYVAEYLKSQNNENLIQMKVNRGIDIKEVKDSIKRKETILKNLENEYTLANNKKEEYYYNGKPQDLLSNGYELFEKEGKSYNKDDIWMKKEDKYFIKISNVNSKYQSKLIDFILENKDKRNFWNKKEIMNIKGEPVEFNVATYYISWESGEIIDLKDKDNIEFRKSDFISRAYNAEKENDTGLKDMMLKEIKESEMNFQWEAISEELVNQILELEKLGIIKKDMTVNNKLKIDSKNKIKIEEDNYLSL